MGVPPVKDKGKGTGGGRQTAVEVEVLRRGEEGPPTGMQRGECLRQPRGKLQRKDCPREESHSG